MSKIGLHQTATSSGFDALKPLVVPTPNRS